MHSTYRKKANDRSSDYAEQNAAVQQNPQAYEALVPMRRTVMMRSGSKRSAKELDEIE